MKKFLVKLLQTIVWLAWQVFPIEEWFKLQRKVVFRKVRILKSGLVVEGDITNMKIEFGQGLRITAAPVGGSGFEAGTEQWSVIAQHGDGSDASGDFTVTPNPENALECDVQHSGTAESTGVVRFQADGDRDTDEEAVIVGTLDFVVDEPNVTAVELSATVITPPAG
jgi:hypothetical protein